MPFIASRLAVPPSSPLKTSNIDESKTKGNRDILRNIFLEQLKLVGDWFLNTLVLVAGDQLSIDRLRKVISASTKNRKLFDRHQWLLPMIQLWHMKWAFLRRTNMV